jgi:excisionase family DNA binding protein
MSEEFYTAEQAAERLKLHPKTVLRLIREERLRATRIGKSYRILRSDLEAFAGVSNGAPAPQAEVYVTSVVEVPDLSAEMSNRLTVLMQAMLISRRRRPHAMQFNAAYDAERQLQKFILIGTPSDTAELLNSLDAYLKALR